MNDLRNILEIPNKMVAVYYRLTFAIVIHHLFFREVICWLPKTKFELLTRSQLQSPIFINYCDLPDLT